ncbi:MAG: TIGR02099 family protein [Thiobacillaceae bacterium]|jgi:uncharacterized protein (TIGR02099 family)|nr:TIGR02099 family protein [Hydrogenophilales bacterium]MBP9915975.1 TIGR02099 family protein [Thiobacillaceae bacterium]
MSPLAIKILRRFYHYAVYVAAGGVIAVCIVALAFKFWVMPNISGYEGLLEDAAGKALGQPVDIGRLEADWHGLNPRVTLRQVRMLPPGGAPLVLPRVEAVWSWLSLPLLDARLASLNIDQPSLAIRRDASGVITVAGIPVNVPGTPSPFPDWLLRQPRIVVKDAQVTWLDEQLDMPPLTYSRVRLLVENRFGRHRFGGIAQPDAAAARRLELRGDFKGRSIHDWSNWVGEAYARVDGARMESWGRWVPWAQEGVKSGVGDLRFWLTLNSGVVTSLTGDARLRQVAISLQKDLPDMAFDSLDGRVGWSRDKDGHSFFVEKLRFKRPGAAVADPASLRISLTPDGRGGFARIGATASNLRLEAFTALTGALPLPRRGHDLIEALNPRGLVESAEAHWGGGGDYSLKARLREGGAQAYKDFPGFSGLSARIQASQDGGNIDLEGGSPTLDWPQVFRESLGFTRLDASVAWKIQDRGIRLDFELDRIVNADLDGMAEGWIDLPNAGPPQVDIRAHLRHGEATAVHRYLPHKVSGNAYEWLKDSLRGGHSDDVRLTLKGALDRFPFDQGGGTFNIAINMVDGVLDYAPDWPRITNIRGKLVFHDKAMTLEATSGNILATRIGPVRVVIPDLVHTHDEIVLIDGRAQGETRAFLDFIRQSPVHGYTDGFTETFKATGDGELAIRLRLPVRNLDTTTVSGNFSLRDNRLDPGGDLPVLESVTGTLSFTDKALQARGIRIRVLGQPAVVDIGNAGASPGEPGGKIGIRVAGRIDAEALKPHLPGPLAARVSGATDWRANIGMNANHKTEFSVESDLTGLRVDLPAPVGKNAADAMVLRVVKLPGGGKPDSLQARYGDQISLRAELADNAPRKINVRLGPGDAPPPGEDGVWIAGNLRFLDVDAWRSLSLYDSQSGPAFREASITFNELRVMNRRLHDTHLRLRPSGNGSNLMVAGREIIGEITTVPDGKTVRILANLKRLILPDPEPGAVSDTPPPPTNLLALELVADKFAWQGRELGELRLRMSPAQGGLKLDTFRLNTPEARLELKGVVADHPRRPTRLDIKLDSDSLGKLLAQFDKPGRVGGGALRIAGNLNWTGGLEHFDLAALSGKLNVAVKQGQFLKVDPRGAKLLSILSLQALPRRIALDFRDVFSEGFTFDEIAGDIHLENGSAYTKDLRMDGPAARVSMSGVVDLSRESQNLRVSIQPRLDDSLAVAGALLGGPVVGLGTLIAGKVLKDPVGQATTFEYIVAGTWDEPLVNKVPRKPKEAAQTPGATP